MRKFVIPSVLAMGLLVAGGCQSKSANESAYDLRTDRSKPNIMSNNDLTGPDRNRVFGNDMDNQNPNFLSLRGTRNGTASSGATNLGVDSNKARQVIDDTKQFGTDSVVINGDRMRVTVFTKGNLTAREKRAATVQLHRKLVKALPRYTIDVSVRDNR